MACGEEKKRVLLQRSNISVSASNMKETYTVSTDNEIKQESNKAIRRQMAAYISHDKAPRVQASGVSEENGYIYIKASRISVQYRDCIYR